MKILLLTYYFAPDLSAGSFRNTPLAYELARQLGSSGSVHVVTTQPNRYASFRVEAATTEQHGNLRIDRIAVPQHNSSFLGQIYTYACYFWQALLLTRRQRYDVIVASSSRLFSGFLGAYLARQQRAPLVLDIRDLFRETMLELYRNPLVQAVLRPLSCWVERYAFGTARHINLVSEGFRAYFAAYPQATYSCHTNGIDELFLDLSATHQLAAPGRVRTILYAGNLGEGQGLEKIIPGAAQRLGEAYQFVVIGDGNTRHKLMKAIADRQLTNVEVRPPMPRHLLLAAYEQADYLLMHLNNLKSVERCIPSKLFEYGATNKPILAGVAGYGAQFVRQHVPNSILFAPGDVNALVQLLQTTPYRTETRTAFIEQFRRRTIIRSLTQQILQTAGHPQLTDEQVAAITA